MLAISFYFVNCVIISCKLSFNSRFTRNQIPIMSFLGFKKAELGCKMSELHLSYDVASGSEITSCNKICKPLVVYRFTGNVITSITTLRT